jgi:HrpA-like RNA helicase
VYDVINYIRKKNFAEALCLYIYSSHVLQAEMLCMPLESLVLRLAVLEVEDIVEFSQNLIEAPEEAYIVDAKDTLEGWGMLEPDGSELPTFLGRFAAWMPLEPSLSLFLAWAAVIGVLGEAIVIAGIFYITYFRFCCVLVVF